MTTNRYQQTWNEANNVLLIEDGFNQKVVIKAENKEMSLVKYGSGWAAYYSTMGTDNHGETEMRLRWTKTGLNQQKAMELLNKYQYKMRFFE